MSQPKIKPPKPKQRKPPHAITQIIQTLENHQRNAQFSLAYIDPPMTIAEHAESVFLTESIFNQLDKKHGPRQKMIVAALMYERMLGGVINYLKEKRKEAQSREIVVDKDGHGKPGFIPSTGVPFVGVSPLSSETPTPTVLPENG